MGRGVGLNNIRRMGDLKDAQGNIDDKADLFQEPTGSPKYIQEDKYAVVRRMQADGHVTGMTGDGVNDAPALRQAEVGIAVVSASDVAKAAASIVLTEPGLSNILMLIEQGRMIYQRILTWIINKISRTIMKSAFVAIAFVVTGKFVVSAFAMLLLVFMTDFSKIALATDHVRPSKKPETWNIGEFVFISAILGLAMTAEALFLLRIGYTRFGLSGDDEALRTFCFLTLLYFAVFSVVSSRERRRFWASAPGKTLGAALGADAFAGSLLTLVGLPGLTPIPVTTMLAIFAFAAISCLVINDTLKAAMFKWRIPSAT